VVERSEWINRLYAGRNEKGLHEIALFVNGVWQAVAVDDFIPCVNLLPLRPAFGYCANGDPRIALIEKAWAKVNGGYLELPKRNMRDALEALTGGPVYWVGVSETPTEEETNGLFRDITNALAQGRIVLCGKGTKPERGGEELSTYWEDGAYSIKAIYELQGKHGREALVKLRGKGGQMSADWSRDSPKWASIGDSIKLSQDEQAMGWNEWMDSFGGVLIGHTDMKVSSAQFEVLDGPMIINFQITTPGEYTFSVHQPFDQDPLFSTLILSTSAPYALPLATTHGHLAPLSLSSPCQSNQQYSLIYYPPSSICSKNSKVVLGISVHGPAEVETFSIEKLEDGYVPEMFFHHILSARQGDLVPFRGVSGQEVHPDVVCLEELNRGPFCLFYYLNRSTSLTLTLSLSFPLLQGYTLLPPHTHHRTLTLSIPPGQDTIVIARVDSPQARIKYHRIPAIG